VNTYPTLPWSYDQDEQNVRKTEVKEASNGVVHIRTYGTRRRLAELYHPRLSRTQYDALMAFYDAQMGPFTYTRTRGGVVENYTLVFTGPPKEKYLKPGLFDVHVPVRQV
jgi:hypothetical protein